MGKLDERAGAVVEESNFGTALIIKRQNLQFVFFFFLILHGELVHHTFSLMQTR